MNRRPTPAGTRIVYALLVVAALLALILGAAAIEDALQPIPQPIRGTWH